MKYGESVFDILYLLTALISGIVISVKARNNTEKLMGFSVLILGLGDAFHLVPRVIDYFTDSDMTFFLGIGKLVTSVTMTVFYVLLYYIWAGYFRAEKKSGITAAVWILFITRIALCAFPQNGWAENSNDMIWAIIRNIPFAALGVIICVLYFRMRKESRRFSIIWILILLSFLFYIPVAVGAGLLPVLGMLMLPKTICYILMIITFLLAIIKDQKKRNAE